MGPQAQRPSPEEIDVKQSEEWKQKGNTAFRSKSFTEAYRCYTEAIALNPWSETLYSNRSAALLSLHRLPLALNDAKKAVDLGPKWAKAYRRKASVLDAMGRYQDAIEVYEQALVIIQSDKLLNDVTRRKETQEVEALLEALLQKQKIADPRGPLRLDVPRDGLYAPGVLIHNEAERRMNAGEPMGQWPIVGSCFRRVWLAEMQFQSALVHLDEYHTRQVPGAPAGVEAIFGRLQTLEELTSALIEDIRVGRFSREQLTKLQLCYRLEQQARNAVGPDMDPNEVIAVYKYRLTEDPEERKPMPHMSGGNPKAKGWDYVRPALQLSIRTALMNGLMRGVFESGDHGVSDLQRCTALIELARAEWPDVDGSLRGRTLEETFLRQVKVQLGESLTFKFLNSLYTSTDDIKRELLDQIKATGQWIVDSVTASPIPEKTAEDTANQHALDIWWGVYYAHYAYPMAKGYSFIGFAQMYTATHLKFTPLDSPTTGNRGPEAADPAHMAHAANSYARSVGWMSPDDPERCNNLWAAIYCLVRRGGYFLADLECLRDMASKCSNYYTPYFQEDIIPVSHIGRHAAGQVHGTASGSERDQICSTLMRWPEWIEEDTELLDEVTHPWLMQVVDAGKGEGHGLLCVTEVIKRTWKRRLEVGEKPEAMGHANIWDDLEDDIKDDWEAVWEDHLKEEGGLKDLVEL